MGFKHRTGGNLSTGGKRVVDEGWYHLAVVGIEQPPTDKDGRIVANGAFRANLEVLAGPTADNTGKGKVTDFLFFDETPGDSENLAELKTKKIDRFFLATSLATIEQLADKDNELDVELTDAVGRQLIAKFEKDNRDPRYVQLSFAEIFHVDDPVVKDKPKDVAALRTIAAHLRWPGGKAPSTKPQTAAATSSPSSKKFDL